MNEIFKTTIVLVVVLAIIMTPFIYSKATEEKPYIEITKDMTKYEKDKTIELTISLKNMKNKNKNKDRLEPVIDVSSVPVTGMPETAFDMVNRYCTYNIQSTAETENMYPTVAQGFNKDIIKTDCDENTDDDEKKK